MIIDEIGFWTPQMWKTFSVKKSEKRKISRPVWY